MRPKSRRGGFMSTGEFNFYLIVLVTCGAMALFFPIFKSIRDAHRRESTSHARP